MKNKMSKQEERELSEAIGMTSNLDISDGFKCYTCGKKYESTENLQLRKCPHEKTRNYYCNEVCFKWRYFHPKHEHDRFKRPTCFGFPS